MKIELSYRYTKLDKTHCFGLADINIENCEVLYRWVWFYMGVYLNNLNIDLLSGNVRLYPFSQTEEWMQGKGKILATYTKPDAKRMAKLICNKIHQKINK